VFGGGFDEGIPLVPVGWGFRVGGVGKGEHGFGTSGKNRVNDTVETGKIIVIIALVNFVKIKNMINPD